MNGRDQLYFSEIQMPTRYNADTSFGPRGDELSQIVPIVLNQNNVYDTVIIN